MLFSETLASIKPAGAQWSAEIGADWFQGRATFGGMVGALGNEVMRRIVPSDRELRGLEVTFVGPVLPGAVQLDAEVLRVGKAVTIAQATMRSAGQVATTLTGIYGKARASAISVAAPAAADAIDVKELPSSTLPVQSGGPIFLQHFEMRWAEGMRPFSGSKMSRHKVYIRHLDIAPLTESHIVALIDVIPSPALQMMTSAAPASSLLWSLEFLRHDHQGFAAGEWWRIDTELTAAADGYASQSSVIFNPQGLPAALSQQLVAVFG